MEEPSINYLFNYFWSLKKERRGIYVDFHIFSLCSYPCLRIYYVSVNVCVNICAWCSTLGWHTIKAKFSHLAPTVPATGSKSTLARIKRLLKVSEWIKRKLWLDFLVTVWFHFHMLMWNYFLLFQNYYSEIVGNSKNEEHSSMSRCIQTFDW